MTNETKLVPHFVHGNAIGGLGLEGDGLYGHRQLLLAISEKGYKPFPDGQPDDAMMYRIIRLCAIEVSFCSDTQSLTYFTVTDKRLVETMFSPLEAVLHRPISDKNPAKGYQQFLVLKVSEEE